MADEQTIESNRKGIEASIIARRFGIFKSNLLRAMENISRYVVWDERYSKLVKRQIVLLLHEYLDKFRITKAIDEATKNKLFPVFRVYAKEAAKINGAQKVYLQSVAMLVMLLASVPGGLLAPFLTPLILKLSISYLIQWLYFIPCAFIIASWLYGRSFRTLNYVLGKGGFISFVIAVISLLALQYLMIYLSTKVPNHIIVYLIAAPFIANEVGLTLLVVALYSSYWGIRLWSNHHFKQSPIVYMIHEHLEALALIDEDPRWVFKIKTRKSIVAHLLLAAKLSESYLYNFLKVGTSHVDEWTYETIGRITAGIQFISNQTLLTSHDSFEKVSEQVAKNFLALLTLNLADCYMRDVSLAPFRSRLSQLINFIKSLVIAVLPLAIVQFLRVFSLITDVNKLDPYTVVFAFWFGWRVILMIDPKTGEQVSSFRDVLNIFSNSNKP